MVLKKIIKPESKDVSKGLNVMATSLVLATTWDLLEYQSERNMFISVWVGEVPHYCRSGRVVIFDLVSHSLSCQ